jgi:hypothetical protein
MRWQTLLIGGLSLLSTTACPHSWGRGGTMDRAVHKDVEHALQEEECTEEIWERF